MTFWHDNGAYTPYGIIVPDRHLHPAARTVQAGRLPGRVSSLYTTTVIVTPYRGAGPAAGRVRDGTHDGRDRRRRSAWTARRCGRRNFIQPDEFPFDQGLIFQDGRPLIYDSGNYPAPLE